MLKLFIRSTLSFVLLLLTINSNLSAVEYINIENDQGTFVLKKAPKIDQVKTYSLKNLKFKTSNTSSDEVGNFIRAGAKSPSPIETFFEGKYKNNICLIHVPANYLKTFKAAIAKNDLSLFSTL